MYVILSGGYGCRVRRRQWQRKSCATRESSENKKGSAGTATSGLVNLGNLVSLVNLVNTSTLTASVTQHATATLSRT
jgi:hypothetical protein